MITKEVIDTIISNALLARSPQQAPGGEHFIVLPGGQVHSLAGLMPPSRVRERVSLIDADSFCDYVNRFKNPDTLIFASMTDTGAKLTAIIDYHGAPVRVSDIENMTGEGYNAYCAAVGGKAFNGDPLPDWQTFRADANKKLQSDAWVAAIKSATIVGESHDPQPRYGSHLVTLELIETEDWKNWVGCNGVDNAMTQEEFAMFLEENQHLFNNEKLPPGLKGAELLELVTTLYAKSNVRYNKQIRLQNGASRFDFEEDVTVSGQVTTGTAPGVIEFPQFIYAAIQTHEGGETYQVPARLKTRISGRSLTIWYETVQLHKIVQDAVLGTVRKVSEKTGIIPLIGKVEGK